MKGKWRHGLSVPLLPIGRGYAFHRICPANPPKRG